MTIGVTEAAAELGITQQRVRELIAAGTLQSTLIGGTHVLAQADVDNLSQRERPPHVRAMSPRIAWAAAALGDGVRPNWLRSDELSRLRSRMADGHGTSGRWQARLRSLGSEQRFRASATQIREVLDDAEVVRTGASATNLDGDALVTQQVDVWARSAETLERLRRSVGLLPSRAGNLVVHTPAMVDLPQVGLNENAYRLVVAVDLLAESDPRALAAGHHLVRQVEDDGRWVDAR